MSQDLSEATKILHNAGNLFYQTGKNLKSLMRQDVITPKHKEGIPDQLCNICRGFDVAVMLEDKGPGYQFPRLILGRYDDVAANHHCPLCRLATAAINNTLIEPIVPGYRDANGNELFCLLRKEQNRYHMPWRRYIKVELRSSQPGKKFAGSRMLLESLTENDIRTDNDWFNGIRQSCDAQIILHADSDPLAPNPIQGPIFHDNTVVRGNKEFESMSTYPMLGCTPPQSFRIDKVQEWHQTCGWCAKSPLTESRNEISMAPPGMRVIDVTEMRIVPAPDKCVYAALSYVWGKIKSPVLSLKANREILEAPDGLLEFNTPRTIREAIDVVRSLGLRYFWVDSLCIIQDDPDYQMQQIKAMDKVYQSAALTIVATSGNSADDSLLAESTQPKVHIEEIQGLKLMARNKPFDWAVVGTTWDTRGWCYQEKMLSARILLFTKTETYYDCSHYTWCESMQWGDYNGRSARPDLRVKDEAKEREEDADFYELWHPMREILHQYTLRSLTNEGDIINAIYGTLKSLSANLVNMVGGLPIRTLTYSLLWQPAATNRRRLRDDPYPSWSWIGWVGPARFPVLLDNNTSFTEAPAIGNRECTRSSIITSWYCRRNNGPPIHLKDVVILPHHNLHYSFSIEVIGREEVLSKTKEITESELDQLCKAEVRLVETSPGTYEYASVSELQDASNTISSSSREISLRDSIEDSGLLQFWTERATMTVSASPMEVFKEKNEPFEYDPALCQFKIVNDKGKWIGSVQMHVDWTGVDSKHEFIILSAKMSTLRDEGKRHDLPRDRAWRSKLQKIDMVIDKGGVYFYDVLMIERRMGVAYRVGLGSIYYADWDAASPERALITLG